MRPSDYVTAGAVLLLAVWVEAALRMMPFSQLLHRLRCLPSDSAARDASAREYQHLPRFVAVAYDILPFPATCLRQSLVLHALLARRGIPSRFCLGVARGGASLDAHAWIECPVVSSEAPGSFSELRTLAEIR
jgi:hypothetical protein